MDGHAKSPKRFRGIAHHVICYMIEIAFTERPSNQQVAEMGICEVLTAPRCPWQNAYAERFIGSLRRECLDHMIIFNESSLRRILKAYFEYYEHSRTHLALEKDAPASRVIQPPELGEIVELPQVGGLHHHYERRAA
jgi:putative transposase